MTWFDLLSIVFTQAVCFVYGYFVGRDITILRMKPKNECEPRTNIR